MIGGFFFKADSNGDSVISPEEGRSARSDFIGQYPALATLLNQTRSMAGESPFKRLAAMLDLEYGKPLSADDAGAAARGALDDLFAVADSDSNGTLTPAEARAASWAGVRDLGNTFSSTAHVAGQVLRVGGLSPVLWLAGVGMPRCRITPPIATPASCSVSVPLSFASPASKANFAALSTALWNFARSGLPSPFASTERNTC